MTTGGAKSGNYYYGARYYNPKVSVWLSVDPLAEKYPHLTPYNFLENNPVNMVDPTGMGSSPIYNRDGNFLGTDNQGIQGKAIAMNEEDFKQGMSHDEALSKSVGAKGLNGDAAKTKLLGHKAGLEDRPDYDGVVTIDEGVSWAKSHPNLRANENDVNYTNATPDDYLYLDASKMNFGSLGTGDFNKVGVEQGVNLLDHVNLLSSRSRYTTYALGRTRMTLLNGSGSVRVSNGSWNAYDWDYGGSNVREGLIWGERNLKGLNDSHGFPISIYGTGKLND